LGTRESKQCICIGGVAHDNRVMAIPRARYQRLLFEAAIEKGVDVRLESRIKSIDPDSPAVILLSGERIECDVVIGADGM
jgi:salicylate hydroxylase